MVKRTTALLSVKQVSEIIGLGEEQIRRLARAEKIKAVTKIKGWLFDEKEIERFIRSRGNR